MLTSSLFLGISWAATLGQLGCTGTSMKLWLLQIGQSTAGACTNCSQPSRWITRTRLAAAAHLVMVQRRQFRSSGSGRKSEAPALSSACIRTSTGRAVWASVFAECVTRRWELSGRRDASRNCEVCRLRLRGVAADGRPAGRGQCPVTGD